jgi:DNA-binding protein Fis
VTLDELEHQYVREVLESVAGNKTEACRVLGITRATLYTKLRRKH